MGEHGLQSAMEGFLEEVALSQVLTLGHTPGQRVRSGSESRPGDREQVTPGNVLQRVPGVCGPTVWGASPEVQRETARPSGSMGR